MERFAKLLFIPVFAFSLVFGGWSLHAGLDVTGAKNVKINKSIHIDQIGYGTKDVKKAVIAGAKGQKFALIEEKSGKNVFEGDLTGRINDKSSRDTVSYADFSKVQTPGSYYIFIPEMGRSYTFKIGNGIYKNVKNSMLKALYYQRCGMKLYYKYAGAWQHDVCHTSKGSIYGTQKTLDGSGGWHDAGDYGKYSVPAAKAMADLMLAYETFPGAFKENVNIPESGNKIPDILDETKYELLWLFKMQDKSSGGVYHKLTSANFPEMTTMPDADISDLIFSPVSPTATGDFAAVMAMASRVYKPFDKQLSAKCLAAAEKAWKWLQKNKNAKQFKNPDDIVTGDYSDTSDKDERYWAAAELYRATAKKEYHDYFKDAYKNGKFDKFDFKWTDTKEVYNMSAFGTITYLNTDRNKVDKTIYNDIKSKFIKKADGLVSIAKADGYGVALKSDEYFWSSNMNVTDKAIFLTFANKFQPKKDYVNTAQDHLHYLFGRNALGQCYVTGFGSKPVIQPSHRPSVADGIDAPVPGLVAGGPDSYMEDPSAQSALTGAAPAKCYIDDATSYSTNEIAIYWNASAVFLAGYFDR